MSAPNFSFSDFGQALLKLLPRGPIWSRDLDGLPAYLANIWGKTFARNSDRAANLLKDSFPATTEELLPEWQKTLALPDPVASSAQTLEQQQSQVVARLTGTGGCSVPYLEQYAKTLGYTVTITPYSAFYFGMPFGSQFGGEGWNFDYLVTVDDAAENDHTVLEYELRRLSQAGTNVFFTYTG
ncbi:YmfQ family protein [Acetobacter cerevisiae]|uniref:YmfQ family protein n=1 Tax=Acetobacter cerevisiae TaxID=178900 RepID=A0ABT1EUD1_9PROT|nr:putative phage tail protein [Acetobacter cerevisiae]MCP1245964.1 YmfQ family protein [Acetobacter cerevisiae]MCP1255682.1 YmfQ family protein [Acetobacter cerevisiae]